MVPIADSGWKTIAFSDRELILLVDVQDSHCSIFVPNPAYT